MMSGRSGRCRRRASPSRSVRAGSGGEPHSHSTSSNVSRSHSLLLARRVRRWHCTARTKDQNPMAYSWRERNGWMQERVYCCCHPTPLHPPRGPAPRQDRLLRGRTARAATQLAVTPATRSTTSCVCSAAVHRADQATCCPQIGADGHQQLQLLGLCRTNGHSTVW